MESVSGPPVFVRSSLELGMASTRRRMGGWQALVDCLVCDRLNSWLLHPRFVNSIGARLNPLGWKSILKEVAYPPQPRICKRHTCKGSCLKFSEEDNRRRRRRRHSYECVMEKHGVVFNSTVWHLKQLFSTIFPTDQSLVCMCLYLYKLIYVHTHLLSFILHLFHSLDCRHSGATYWRVYYRRCRLLYLFQTC